MKGKECLLTDSTNIKENGLITIQMDSVKRHLPMEIHLKVNMLMVRRRVRKVNTFGIIILNSCLTKELLRTTICSV